MLQCFVKQPLPPEISRLEGPRLLYVSRIDEQQGALPRVMHSHADFIELILVFKGQGQFSIDGRQVAVRAGDLVVYNCDIIHDEDALPHTQLGWFCVAISHVNQPALPANTLVETGKRPVFTTGVSFDHLLHLYEMIFDQLSQERQDCLIVSHHLTQALLALCLQVIRNPGSIDVESAGDADEPLAHRVAAYLDTHYMEDLSLTDLGEVFRVSPYYLAHLFKAQLGYAPMQYRLRRRIGEAQSLLLSTDWPVTEIAARVGYDNPSHFNRQFSKFIGLPPRLYRRKYLKTPPDPLAQEMVNPSP
jgi:AraC-like DNA-binding protein/quercetin dioxygenase-like cupin family protein